MDIFEILDKLADYLNVPELKQDHAEAFLRMAVLEAYHGFMAAGKDEQADKVKEFGTKYCGLDKDAWTLLMDRPA